ncbi:putative Pectin lyase fold/virulence factor [Seiridium cardinale]
MQSERRNIIFSANTTYGVNFVTNTTGLENVTIDIHSTLLAYQWSTNTTYWLDNSIPVGYQNQFIVWFLGGESLKVNGQGTVTIDGNGQTWYNLVKGRRMWITTWGSKGLDLHQA